LRSWDDRTAIIPEFKGCELDYPCDELGERWGLGLVVSH
jgi:hypothetical protein